MNTKGHILLVEDNPQLAAQTGDYLGQKGFTVDFASTGQTARNLLAEETFDLVILDLTLPDVDGLTLAHFIKHEIVTNIPVLMLTARDSLEEKLAGFEAGTDDYLTKPFSLEEVYVRSLALTRRHQLHRSSTIEIGELRIDLKQYQVHRKQVAIGLSSTDFTILKTLAEAWPEAVSKRTLSRKIWGDESPDSDAIRSHVYTLRNAIDKPFDWPMVKTLHGIGFKLVTRDDNES